MRTTTLGERLARRYAATIVALRWPLAIAWVAALACALVFLPGLSGSSTAPLNDIVPANARALQAEQLALRLFGSTLATDTVVVERDPRGLPRRDLRTTLTGAAGTFEAKRPPIPGIKAAVPLVNVPAGGVRFRERNTTALTYLFLAPDLNLVERRDAAHRYLRQVVRPAPGTTAGVTGAGPARLTQFDEIDRMLPWVELATVLVILAIVAVYFRSVGAPLVTLGVAAMAYLIAVRVLGWVGERTGMRAPSEIEPVLVVLLLGLVTDYTVFFLSETRRRLLRGEPRLEAARRASARIAPIVLTAGIVVAACSAALLAGKMEFFRVFGPGLAACALVVTVVSVTLVPALVAIAGPRLFGRRVREAQAAGPDDDGPDDIAAVAVPGAPEARRERWRLRLSGPLGALRASRRGAERDGGLVATRFLARVMTARPVALLVAAACIAALGLAAWGGRTAHMGVSFIPSLPHGTEVRTAADAATRGFVPGVLSPTDVIVQQPGIGGRQAQLAALQRLIARRPGIAVVLGPAQAQGGALRRFAVSRDGGAARFVLMLAQDPTGSAAIRTIKDLRAAMPQLAAQAGLPRGARVAYAGETALAAETVDAIAVDLRRVAIAAAILGFLLLALFLRSLVAPIVLLAGSALAVAAAYGLTALLLPSTLGGHDVVYYVPLVAGVMLVGLGSDYNVAIAGRIREEAQRRRLREAIAVGAPAASRAITVAGLTLAATFALLALVPLRPFRELAMFMTLGVLVDALLVRPVLVPSLIAVLGRATWWPGTPRRPVAARAFVERVAALTGENRETARVATCATLHTLAERVPEREAAELARHLPSGLIGESERDAGCEPFGHDEFLARVAERAQVAPDVADRDARAVLAVVAETLPQEELDYVRAALSEDYRPLFGDGVAAPDEPEPEAAGDDVPRFTSGRSVPH